MFIGQAKLCDFGFARHLTNESQLATSMKGTPLYMAPEIMNESPYDQLADLWSVGCILYQLVCGKSPFHTKELNKLIQKARYEKINWSKKQVMKGKKC